MANAGTSDPTPAGGLATEQDRHHQDQPPAAPDVNFWAVFESAPDAYLLLAPDPPRFTMVAANEARLRVTMTRREDVIGHPLFEVFPDNPTDPGATGVRNLQASLNEVLRTGKPHRMPLQKYDIRTPDGEFEERYWDPLNSPVFDDRGNWIYIIHRVEDVTEQVLAQMRARENESILARLRESEARYRLLADMIPQNIWTTDAEGHHTYFSRRWYDYSGATPEESRGEGWLQFIHPDDRERTVARWRHSLETGEPYSIEYRFRGADGEYRWWLGQAMPLRNEAGEIVEWFGTTTDISERKQLDEERERLLEREREARAEAERRREEVERVTESRTRLMRGFTHDVKNPLGAADGYAQLLEDGILGELSSKQVESVQRIRRSIQRSLHLINELLELARAEAGQIELELVPTDIAELVRETAEDFRAQAAAAGLGLEVRVGEALLTRTDPARVRQILSNLLSNAVKYTPEGGITVEAGLRADGSGPRGGEWIAIGVTDTGPGIPAGKRELIFQEFTRLDPEAQHGAGVGLAISRRIARLLDGDITVESPVNGGSTFTLWLPLAARS
jgi:PAS domain S-box-containing protein